MGESKRIFFFGDSICFGQGVSIHHGWVPRLASEVEDLGHRLGVEMIVINASVNGNTTRQALERMPYDVQSHGVDVLIVQFGMNDCNYWHSDGGVPRVSQEGFKANLHEIITRGLVFGAQHVFLNTNHPSTRNREVMEFTDKTYQQSNEEYNRLTRDVCSRHEGSVTLVDIESAVQEAVSEEGFPLENLLLDDGLHLSRRGHDIYFDQVRAGLIPKLNELYGEEPV